MHFLPEKLDDYIVDHSQKEPELLQQLSKETWQKVLAPRMLSGHFQGRVLSLISKMVNPKYILEIGTYTGYSALCLAEGIQTKGLLHTIDNNEEIFDLQRKYFDKSIYEVLTSYSKEKFVNEHFIEIDWLDIEDENKYDKSCSSPIFALIRHLNEFKARFFKASFWNS